MNIEMARAIPMPEILRKIGLQPAKPGRKDYWYYSPFRTEKTPSFDVNLSRNVWYDFGEGRGEADRHWRTDLRERPIVLGATFGVIWSGGERGVYRVEKIARPGSKTDARVAPSRTRC